jgi:hypothetical protein
MAAAVTGSLVSTKTLAPHLTPTVINALIATAMENLTIAQFYQALDMVERLPAGDTARTIKSFL